MPSFKRTIANAKDKIAKAELTAFTARREAIAEVLDGADVSDVILLAAYLIADVFPTCCVRCQNEFKHEVANAIGDAVRDQHGVAEEAGDEIEDGIAFDPGTVHQVH